ncbi:MAG TPA: hypothetical protein VK926_04375 [Gaiellaceae bacterium]|nr:hypothetical protein [Gaiellaceae bacterium]
MDLESLLAEQSSLDPDDPRYVPLSFGSFLRAVLDELPELRPIVDREVSLWEEIFTTPILGYLSSAVMERQGRVLAGEGTDRDRAIVDRWLALGEEAMSDPFLADVFASTAGDDLLFDERGRSLHDRLGPLARQRLQSRYPWMITNKPPEHDKASSEDSIRGQQRLL